MNRREFIKTSAVAAAFAGAPSILRADGAKRLFRQVLLDAKQKVDAGE